MIEDTFNNEDNKSSTEDNTNNEDSPLWITDPEYWWNSLTKDQKNGYLNNLLKQNQVNNTSNNNSHNNTNQENNDNEEEETEDESGN